MIESRQQCSTVRSGHGVGTPKIMLQSGNAEGTAGTFDFSGKTANARPTSESPRTEALSASLQPTNSHAGIHNQRFCESVYHKVLWSSP